MVSGQGTEITLMKEIKCPKGLLNHNTGTIDREIDMLRANKCIEVLK